MLPAFAIFAATLSVGYRGRRFIVLSLFAIAAVSVWLDMLQMAGGVHSPLRFYAITNFDRAVGFFANSNHNAAFLYSVIVFATAWAIQCLNSRNGRSTFHLVLFAFLLGLLFFGLSLTSSRAGLGLGFLGALLTVVLTSRAGSRQSLRFRFGVAVGSLIVVLVVFQFGFISYSERFADTAITGGFRWAIDTVTARAAERNLPFGSGLGTFVPVFQMFEPRFLVKESYINHAHNDWLELWLEAGVPALVLGVAFLAWFGKATLRLWRLGAQGASAVDGAIVRAAPIVVILLMLHSTVDYPLRTIAMMGIFAFCCAILMPPSLGKQALPAGDIAVGPRR